MTPADLLIRPLDPTSDDEIALVATRMRDTLIEVEGEAVGGAMYSMDWLQQRVRWHLDAQAVKARVLLAVLPAEGIIGHTIVRVEPDGSGLFSTTYVLPAVRRLGIAGQLLLAGEAWLKQQGVPEIATWTSAANHKLIQLYAQHGYAKTADHRHHETGTPMVKLSKLLTPDPG